MLLLPDSSSFLTFDGIPYPLKPLLIYIFLFLIPGINLRAQQLIKHFRQLSHAEKQWVYAHPFVAKKAFHITQEVLKITQAELTDSLLDGKANGGQVDAFRHAFWMVRLANGIGTRKARLLGIAHEKGNKEDFLKNRTEEGALSDSLASVMDLKNNQAGLELAHLHPRGTLSEMKTIVIDAAIRGKLFILLMDVKNNYYDCSGNKLDMQAWKDHWNIPKCLVTSNTKVGIFEK